MRLPLRQGDGGVLAEIRGQAMPLPHQKFLVNIRLQAHMAAVIAVALLHTESSLPVNIGMALGI